MGYEISKFGDAGYTAGTSNVQSEVSNHYGQRYTGGTNGRIKTEGGYNELTFDLDLEVLENEKFTLTTVPFMPAQSKVDQVIVIVDKAFSLAGTDPTILIGTADSEVTNGFVITKAQAEAEGIYDVSGSLTGTWDAASELKALTNVGVALGGTNPVPSGSGKIRVVVRYFHA